MTKKKLVLVNPSLSNPFPGFPPLSLGYVAALTPDDWDVEMLDENFELATFRQCDLVGITAFTATANRAYQVAKIFRDKDVPVVMGGIHASMMPDEALQHVDAVVIGEAETVWGDVVADMEAGELQQKYNGTHTDLKGMVHPRRDLFDDRYFADSVQTARGCPNDCEFCSVSRFNGYVYRQRPIDEVLEEISTLKKKYLFIVDDNIVGLGAKREQRVIELTRGMVERKFKKIWYGQAGLNVADNEEVLKSLRAAGCVMLLLGIESENADVLKTMKKNINLRRDYKEAFAKIHKHGIGIHGSLIFGTDDDTMEMLQRRVQFMLDSHIDVVQYCASTPYPGTKLFEDIQKQGRLIHTNFPADWDRYDLSEVLFKPQHLETEEFRRMMYEVAAKVYNRPQAAKRFFRTLYDTRDIITAFWCFFTGLLYKAPKKKTEGQEQRKFWYLDPETWPYRSHMNPEMLRHAERYWSEPAPGN
ncbi:MAG: B12-binding domain-containing radical SAM protein [Deltaproteobacteria bacterium]|nr:B12-binding domain-containing radical SAM protein [Deltaproteobacteria bacterium]